MNNFFILTSKNKPMQIIKRGFNWPAFFLNIFWALAQGFYGIFFGAITIYFVSLYCTYNFFNLGDFFSTLSDIFSGRYYNYSTVRIERMINRLFYDYQLGLTIFLYLIIQVPFIFAIILGVIGNNLKTKKLIKKQDYIHSETIFAANKQHAMTIYNENQDKNS